MAVNERLDGYDLTDPTNNTPDGSSSIGSDLDNHLRDIKKNIGYAARWVHEATVVAVTTVSSTSLHRVMPVNTTAGDITVNLGTAASVGDGMAVFVLKTGGTNNVIVDNFQGGDKKTLSITNQAVLAICDGTSWFPMLGAGSMTAGGDVDISAAPSLSFSATAVDATNDKLLIHDDTDGTNKKINVAAVVGAGIPAGMAGQVVKMDYTQNSSTVSISGQVQSDLGGPMNSASSSVIASIVYKPTGLNRLIVRGTSTGAHNTNNYFFLGLFRKGDGTSFQWNQHFPTAQPSEGMPNSWTVEGGYTATVSTTITLVMRGAVSKGTVYILSNSASSKMAGAVSTLSVTEIKL